MKSKKIWLKKMLTKNSHSQIVGELGERLVREHLQERGYTVIAPDGNRKGDLIVADRSGVGISVEVKTAKFGKWGWNFCLKKRDKHGYTNAYDSQIVILLCVGKSGRCFPFVASTKIFKGVTKFGIRSHPTEYQGKLAPYLQTMNSLSLELNHA